MPSLNVSFYDALKGLVDGKVATRVAWMDDQYYITLLNEKLVIHKPDQSFYPLTVQLGDIVATDWVFIN